MQPTILRKQTQRWRPAKETNDPIDRAIAEAIDLQKYKQYDKAREKWEAIANLTEGRDNEAAARAYFSAAWLIHEYDDKYKAKDEKTLNYVISLYDQLLKIKPNDATALYNRGLAKSELGDFNGAIQDFNQTLKIKPDFAEAYCNRGNIKLELGDFDGAMQDYNQTLKIKPDLVIALYNMGNAKLDLGDFNGAIQDYDQVLKIKPDFASAYGNRGNAKLQLGYYDDAKKDAKKALEIEPDDEVFKQLLVYIEKKQQGEKQNR